jgi:hypothetical protein
VHNPELLRKLAGDRVASARPEPRRETDRLRREPRAAKVSRSLGRSTWQSAKERGRRFPGRGRVPRLGFPAYAALGDQPPVQRSAQAAGQPAPLAGVGGPRPALVVNEAAALLRGEADLVLAGLGRPVPVPVKLGVLAHADLERLSALGRYRRRGSVRRTWGTLMASVAGELALSCRTPLALANLQAQILVPLELEVLAGRRYFGSDEDLAGYVRRHVLSLSC